MTILKNRTRARISAYIDWVLDIIALLLVLIMTWAYYNLTKSDPTEVQDDDWLVVLVFVATALASLLYVSLFLLSAWLIITTNGTRFDLSKARCSAVWWRAAQVVLVFLELLGLIGKTAVESWIIVIIFLLIRVALIYNVHVFISEINKAMTHPELFEEEVVPENVSNQHSNISAQLDASA